MIEAGTHIHRAFLGPDTYAECQKNGTVNERLKELGLRFASDGETILGKWYAGRHATPGSFCVTQYLTPEDLEAPQ